MWQNLSDFHLALRPSSIPIARWLSQCYRFRTGRCCRCCRCHGHRQSQSTASIDDDVDDDVCRPVSSLFCYDRLDDQ